MVIMLARTTRSGSIGANVHDHHGRGVIQNDTSELATEAATQPDRIALVGLDDLHRR
jgi:hypothetical protein